MNYNSIEYAHLIATCMIEIVKSPRPEDLRDTCQWGIFIPRSGENLTLDTDARANAKILYSYRSHRRTIASDQFRRRLGSRLHKSCRNRAKGEADTASDDLGTQYRVEAFHPEAVSGAGDAGELALIPSAHFDAR